MSAKYSFYLVFRVQVSQMLTSILRSKEKCTVTSLFFCEKRAPILLNWLISRFVSTNVTRHSDLFLDIGLICCYHCLEIYYEIRWLLSKLNGVIRTFTVAYISTLELNFLFVGCMFIGSDTDWYWYIILMHRGVRQSLTAGGVRRVHRFLCIKCA